MTDASCSNPRCTLWGCAWHPADSVTLRISPGEFAEIRARADTLDALTQLATPAEWALFDVVPPEETFNSWLAERFGEREPRIVQAVQTHWPVRVVLEVQEGR